MPSSRNAVGQEPKDASGEGGTGKTPNTRQAERPQGLARERFRRHRQLPTFTKPARTATGAR